jgi:hypothetical protein
VVTAVLLTAAVILSHNLMALLFFGMLVAWAVWQSLLARRLQWRLFLLLGLGLGAAAFFWLPVYGERNAVNLNTLLGAGDNYDFRTHFLSLYELFSPRRCGLDWGASQPDFRFNLGRCAVAVGGIGIVEFGIAESAGAGQTWYFAVAGHWCLFLMLPVSTFIWETVPFLPFFQFPWRLLGPAAIVTAVLAGAGVSALQPYVRRKFPYLTTGSRAAAAAAGTAPSASRPVGGFRRCQYAALDPD